MEIDETKLKDSLELFLKCDIKFDMESSNILRLKSYTSNNLNALFKYFCSNILNLNYISSIAKHFPELLLPIVYEVFSIDDNTDNAPESLYTSDALWQLHQRKCIVLSRLIQYSPAILRHSYKYFTKYPSPFDKPFSNNVQPIKKKKKHFRNSKIDGYLIDCAHSFLKSNVNFYKNQWNWSEFILNYCGDILTDPIATNAITVKYCNEILAMLTEMTPIQRYRKFTLESLIEYDIAIKAGNISEHSILNTNDHSNPAHLIKWNNSLNSFINIDGITLPIFNIENANYYKNNNNNYERDVASTVDNIVMVKSTKSNLRNIALGIATGNAICLTGPVGCGKTSLVEYLARITGRILRKSQTNEQPLPKKINNKRKSENGNNNNLVIVDELSTSNNGISNENVVLNSSAERKRVNPENGIESHDNDDDDWDIPDLQKENSFLRIQLGDQTDSKMLLGQYRCTDVPGEFIWQAGVLTQAVMNGYWLLLEDLDLATQDVCTILTNLLENNYLSVSGFRDYLPITPGFQLFVTLRTPRQTHSSQQSMFQLLDKYLFTINILPLSHNELSEIICNNFPKLTTVANRIVDVYIEYSSGNHLMNNDDFGGEVEYLNSENDNDDGSEKNVNESNVKSLGDQNTSKRLLSTRDLMKLCKRSHSTFSVTSIECAYFVLQNAIDLFCSYLPSGQKKTEYIIKIGSKLGIAESRCAYLANEYKPLIELNGDEIKIGRTHLSKRNTRNSRYESDQQMTPEPETEQLIKRKQPTFSFTRPAACILERIAVCIQQNEPILLVGETGVGKTSSVQYLAYQTNHKLCVINMNNQSDISDLIGGYKPVDVLFIITGMRNEFEILFRKTYVATANEMFFNGFSRAMHRKNYMKLIQLMLRVCDDAVTKKAILKNTIDNRIILNQWAELKLKVLKLQSQLKQSVNVSFAFITGSLVNCIRNGDWVLLDEINLATTETLECLSTILEPDGSIVLLERGDYYPIERHPDFRIFACMNPNTDIGKKDLPISIRNRFTEFFIDELTVENDLLILVNDYLQNTGINKGKIINIVKLYKSLRNASELQLNDGLGNRPIYSLRTLCRALHICRKNLCGSIERNLYESFSISFLTQLDYESYCKVTNMIQTIILTTNKKALLSHPIPKPAINGGSSTTADRMEYIDFEGYWITRGPCPIMDCENYILTENVRTNLKNIARIISIGKLPILLQGPTSAGKTSLIEYIAQKSGNYCLRVNNHEHTDLQEYIGTYVTDLNGKLVFKEGVLVQAMRNGYWIILDELNLASSDILEALNRVLDDNRELFIPETQQLIRAHENFMLFATQNPPGIYGGRKTLSRAFKNRFIELHFDEIPRNELEIILEKRCKIPKSLACKMVKTIGDLQLNRKHATKCTFTLRDLFRWGNRYTYADEALLANRLYDWNQHLIDEGYLVLSSRVRNSDELELIEKVLFTHFRKHINLDNLYRLHEQTSMVTRKLLTNISDYQYHKEIVWTDNLLRMAVITGKALQFNEPVLLVGPTGCGKTTICQILADIVNRKLRILNCHMHTEGADFLGGLRPYRNENDTTEINGGDNNTDTNEQNKSTFNKKQLFEWKNGPLIMAMQNGEYFLADEISLAEDSVLERLNCILEPERTVLLSEKGGVNGNFLNENIQSQSTDNNKRKPNEIETEFIIQAKKEFQFFATMNPGGDFGKRELSPALRNRFTEIWCPETNNLQDLQKIAKHSLLFIGDLNLNNMDDKFERLAFIIVDTIMFIKEKIEKFNYSIRDILAWVSYIIINYKRERVMLNIDVVGGVVDPNDDIKSLCNIMLYGLEIIFLDALEMLPYTDEEILQYRLMISNYFLTIFDQKFMINILYENIRSTELTKSITMDHNKYGINPFYILTNPNVTVSLNEINDFSFGAQTTLQNLFRLLSALTLKKPILLEGPPGVGKTSLIENLAKQIGYKIVRINLCEHTDLTDLFGSDLPADDDLMLKLNKIDDEPEKVDDKKPPTLGSFVWRDGPLLSAIKTPYTWILLDELNLAPQSVLEGLNAILDHRGEVYIPELNKTFALGQDTRIFASQNPLRQGGGRKGLPQSFLNRFTKVYLTKLQSIDFTFVVHDMYSWYIEKLQEFFNIRPSLNQKERTEEYQQFNELQNLINNLYSKMIAFSADLDKGIHNLEFGYEGGPYEVNLRDILRWCDFVSDNHSGFVPFLNANEPISSEKHIERFLHDFMLIIYEKMKLVYCERMRNDLDKNYINEIFSKHFHYQIERLIQESNDYSLYWTDKYIYVNNLKLSKMEIQNASEQLNFKHSSSILLASQRNTIYSLMDCILMSKPVILCGPSDCGKTKSIHLACSILNRSCNVDTIDDTVTGSFQQIDFNRHLEVIARQIECNVNCMIKSLLLQQTIDLLVIDNVTKLFQSWENYKKLLNKDYKIIQQNAMSKELILFNKKLLSLEHVIAVLLDMNKICNAIEIHTIQTLQMQIKNLSTIIQNRETLNTGGSFEWIDSIFVKSMKNGEYISLEHVNLCSSAILDRLNSVFEPNGQLLISEKGVVIDNDIDSNNSAEIVGKHKEFRAFLTLDPKHGEISRAMRNRCIEVYLKRDRYTEDDLKQLLYENGLVETFLIDGLYNIHKRVQAIASDYNQFGISHLIKCGFLISENLRKTNNNVMNVNQAIRQSCHQVYVYSSTIDYLGFGLKYYHQQLKKEIQNGINDIQFYRNAFNYKNIILNGKELNAITLVRYQCEPFLTFMRSCGQQITETVNFVMGNLFSAFKTFDFSTMIDNYKILLYILFDMSTFMDFKQRATYLRHMLNEIPQLENNCNGIFKLIDKLSDKLDGFLLNTVNNIDAEFDDDRKAIPWNNKLFPRLRDYNKLNGLNYDWNSKVLKLSSHLLAASLLNDFDIEQSTKFIDLITYSRAIHEQLIINSNNSELINVLFHYVQELRLLIDAVIQSDSMEIKNYQEFIKLMLSLLWCNRLVKASQVKLYNKSQWNDILLKQIWLHVRWTHKYISIYYGTLTNEFDEKLRTLYGLYEKMEKSVFIHYDNPLNGIRKYYTKQYLNYLPNITNSQATTNALIYNVHDMLFKFITDYHQNNFDPMEINRKFLTLFNTNLDVDIMKAKLIQLNLDTNLFVYFKMIADNFIIFGDAKMNIPQSIKNAIGLYEKSIMNPEEMLSEFDNVSKVISANENKIKNNITEESSDDFIKHIKFTIDQLPILEYFTMKILNCLQCKWATTKTDKDKEITEINEEYFTNIKTLPIEILSIIKLTNTGLFKVCKQYWTNPKDRNKVFSSLLFNINSTIQTFNLTSLSTNYSLCYRNDTIQQNKLTNLFDDQESTIHSSHYNPLLTMIATKILYQTQSSSSIGGGGGGGDIKLINLGDLNKWKHLSNSLQHLLWMNCGLFQMKYNFEMLNYCFVLDYAKNLLNELEIIEEFKREHEQEQIKKYNNHFNTIQLDFNRLVNKFTDYSNILTIQEKQSNCNAAILQCLIGAIELNLKIYVPLISPKEKNQLKRLYKRSDIKLINNLLKSYEFMKISLNYEQYGNEIVNELNSELSTQNFQLNNIQKKIGLYGNEIQLLPEKLVEEQEEYNVLVHTINDFLLEYCHPKKLYELIENAEKCFDKSKYNTSNDFDHQNDMIFKMLNDTMKRIDSWIQSSISLQYDLRKYFINFKEFMHPIENAITTFKYGLTGLRYYLKKQYDKMKLKINQNVNGRAADDVDKFELIIKNIIEFPSINGLNLIGIHQTINQIFTNDSVHLLLLFKSKLFEIKNSLIIRKEFNSIIYNDFNKLIKIFNRLWIHQEDLRRLHKIDESSLYVRKKRNINQNNNNTNSNVNGNDVDDDDEDDNDIVNEKQLQKSIERIFPNYVKNDFNDFMMTSNDLNTNNDMNIVKETFQHAEEAEDEEEQRKKEEQLSSIDNLLNDNDVKFLCDIFCMCMSKYTKSMYYDPKKLNEILQQYKYQTQDINDSDQLNYTDVYYQSSLLFQKFLNKCNQCLNSSIDDNYFNGISLICYMTQIKNCTNPIDELNTPNELKLPKQYNFYKDSNVTEIHECTNILDAVDERVRFELQEWPDHAALNDISKVIQRIRTLPITSALARFSTGFQLLREKIDAWNKVSHNKNHLKEEELKVAEYIHRWTKLELQSWRECLSQVNLKVQLKAYKLFFYVFDAVTECLRNKTNELLNEHSIGSPERVMPNDNEHEIGLIDTLNQFLESASYGDFAIRLKIIKSFEQYLGHMHDNELIREQMRNYRLFLISIFYNIHLYFSQFTNEIDECIKAIRQPIEKKLKEFVRIESYNKDISYFSMNADISRIHRHLHKFLKEFEKGLKQPVNQLFQYKESQTTAALDLNVSNEKGMNLRHQSKINYYMMDAKNYILSELYQKKMMQRKSLVKLTYPTTITLLLRIDKLFYTSRVICHDAIQNSRFPMLIYALQNLLMEQTERLDDLRKLEVDRGQVRAKQKIQAKNILQQKRKGLSDFYKILTTLGINYRTGLMEQTIQKHLINIKIQPFSIPLLVNVNHTSIALKSRHKIIDHKLLYLNENLDLYYSKCVFRLKLLQNILLKPNDALGLRNLERIKGYAVDLFLLVQTQRETISNSYNEMHCLKEQIQCLLNLDDCMKITADKNCDDEQNHQIDEHIDFIQLRTKYSQIKENLFKIYNVFEQYKLLLKCIPDADQDLCVLTHNRYSLYKNSEKYNRIDTFIRNILNTVKLILHDLEKLDDMKFFNFKIINEFEMKYDGIQNDMKLLSNEFLLTAEDKSNDDHSNTKNEYLIIGNGLFELLTELKLNSLSRTTTTNTNEKDFDLNQQQNDMHNVDMELENIVHKILYSMQTLYKKYPKQNKNDSLTKTVLNNSKENNSGNDADDGDDHEDNEEHEHNILENHLKTHITKELQYDLEILNITDICKKLQNILLIIEYEYGSESLQQKTIIEKAIKLLPILQQFYLLCKYYLIQQIGAHKVSVKVLSTMLIIFLELGKNGFCIPPDLMQKEDDEDGDEGKNEGEQKKEGGGFGLDDNGTGEKDVSDKIESEDQLDTAKKPGSEEKKEEKNEDADCKEEKGIDMSEDFDSKLQDIEKRNEDDSDTNESDSEDEKDLDKEMGETEPGADKLDDQIWGSDDEKDPNESDEDEKDMNDEEDGDGSKEENDSHNNLDAQNDKQKKTNPDDTDNQTDGLDATNEENDDNKREKQKDIDQFEEPQYDEEQVNTKHNELEEPPEPEDMNIDDMVNLDNDDGRNDKDENNEENPFDIDRMKEQIDPKDDGDGDEEENAEDDKDNDEQNENDVDSSDDDDEGQLKFDRKNNETEEINEEDADDKENDKNEQLEGNVDEDEKDGDDGKDENENKGDDEKNPKTDENEYHESNDKKSQEENIQAMPDQQNKGSTDQVQNDEEQLENNEIKQKDDMDTQDTGEDQQALGQADNEKSESGHQGIAKDTKDSKRAEQDRPKINEQKEKRTKGHTNEERTISDAKENKMKQLKTIDKLNTDKNDDQQQLDEDPKLDDDNENVSEEHQHVKDAKRSDKTTLDNATEEQSKQIRHEDQTQTNLDDENNDEDQSVELPPSDTEPDDIEILDDKDVELLESEKTEQKSEKKSSKTDRTQEQCDINKEQVDVEGDIIDTHNVVRGNETRAHCVAEILQDKSFPEEPTAIEALELRKLYEKEKMSQKLNHPQSEHFELWQSISNRMLSNARELCEQLRLILEPTKCTRLKGDYRTGRRINMKKIIPYIASQFRKDKIWLRRTKPAQRDYKITIAIDDSKSMDHNNSKELTLQAISLVSQALTLLESGKLSVISFGETTQILLNYFDQFNGPKLVQSLMFNQNKTCIAGLLDFIRTANTEESYCGIDNGIFENLLLILSDGRNIFSEGIQRVKNAVKLARLQRIFIVYIIIDNPENEHSILDIQTPTFSTDGKVLTMKSYMDTFPFPYYVIVRDLAQLPLVLSDAMRQWFELVNSE